MHKNRIQNNAILAQPILGLSLLILWVSLTCLGCQTSSLGNVSRTYTIRILGETEVEFRGGWKTEDSEETVEGTTPAVFEVRSRTLEATFERVGSGDAILLRITEGNRIWGETIASPPKSTVNAKIHEDGATWFISY